MANGPKILIVDDEPAVRRFLRTCLERKEYVVFEAENGEAALEVYGQQELDINLVICDIRMPGINGNEVARRIQALKPSQRILFVTAFPGLVENANHFDTLAKPFSVAQLLSKVTRLLAWTAIA